MEAGSINVLGQGRPQTFKNWTHLRGLTGTAESSLDPKMTKHNF